MPITSAAYPFPVAVPAERVSAIPLRFDGSNAGQTSCKKRYRSHVRQRCRGSVVDELARYFEKVSFVLGLHTPPHHSIPILHLCCKLLRDVGHTALCTESQAYSAQNAFSFITMAGLWHRKSPICLVHSNASSAATIVCSRETKGTRLVFLRR